MYTLVSHVEEDIALESIKMYTALKKISLKDRDTKWLMPDKKQKNYTNVTKT